MKNPVHIISQKPNPKLCMAINKSLDNYEATDSSSINEFITKSTTNKYFPSRILLISKAPTGVDDLKELYYYLRENSENTEVVLICQYTEDNGVGEAEIIANYKDIFQESNYQVAYVNGKWTYKSFNGVTTQSLTELEERSDFFEKEHNITYDESLLSNGDPDFGMGFWGNETSNNFGMGAETFGGKEVEEDEDHYGNDPLENPFDVDQNNFENSWGTPENTENVWETQNSGYSTEPENNADEIFSLGSIGSKHVETGFLTDEPEEVLIQERSMVGQPPVEPDGDVEDEDGVENVETGGFARTGTGPVQRQSILNKMNNFEKEEPQEIVKAPVENTPGYQAPQPHFEPPARELTPGPTGLYFNSADGKIELVLGLRDIDTSDYVIGEAFRCRDQGLNVLIVDYDYRVHNVVSSLNIAQFNQSQARGVSIYEEDGLHFLSPGYDKKIEAIYPYLQQYVNRFDKVFIDAPLDVCTNVKIDFLPNLLVNLVVRGDFQSYIRTYQMADTISDEMALNYFYNGKVTVLGNNQGWHKELLEFRNMMVPRRVDWLNDAYLDY